jgi:hypothetical protein
VTRFIEAERIRTFDNQFRKLMLYPAELQPHCKKTKNTKTEKGGFEPPDPLPGQLLSREPDSTALAPLQGILFDQRQLPEREGFEPPETCASTVFKTASFDHSDISPKLEIAKEHRYLSGRLPPVGFPI